MNPRNPLWLISSLLVFLLLTGCHSAVEKQEETIRLNIPVTVSGIRKQTMAETMELKAVSKFLDIAAVKSPAAAFVQQTHVEQGEQVEKGQLLFTLKTREATALEMDTSHPLAFSGLIRVHAGMKGIVTQLDHPDGDFVQEGDNLGTIAIPASLVFILQVPYEQVNDVRVNSVCSIRLPDGRQLEGKIASRLPYVSQEAQTQQFIVTPTANSGIPENLLAKVVIPTVVHPNAVTLPGSCVLADEIMQHFWVMKLVDDTMAVKVPVRIGITREDWVEIIEPPFEPENLFLASGNYGLGDTAFVQVTTRTADE